MIDTDYSLLKSAALLASKGQREVEQPKPGSGCWVHDGERHHVADNVSPANAAFIAAASPQKIVALVDDLAQERSLRLAAEQELAELRRENEMLRTGMKGDYDLDAWLDWSVELKKLHDLNALSLDVEARLVFEEWYLDRLSPGSGQELRYLMPWLFDRHNTDEGQYICPDVQIQWVPWKARADLDNAAFGQAQMQVLKQQLEDTQRQLGKEQTLQEDGERFRHLMFYHVDWAKNGKDDDAVMLTFGPFPSNRLRVAVDTERAEKAGEVA